MSDTTYRWIMYTSQNIPGNQSFDLTRQSSLDAVRDEFAEYRRAVGTDECTATLYAYSADAWASAEEFREVGCPFDYPDRLVETGPNGGIVISGT